MHRKRKENVLTLKRGQSSTTAATITKQKTIHLLKKINKQK